MIDKLPYGFINSVYGFNDYTLNELICKIAQKMDEVITQSNESFNYLDWLKGQGLSDEVIKIMLEWKENGTFETLINEQLFNGLNTKIDNSINEINEQLNTKVQQFIDGYANVEYFNDLVVDKGTENEDYIPAINKCLELYGNCYIPKDIQIGSKIILDNYNKIKFAHKETTIKAKIGFSDNCMLGLKTTDTIGYEITNGRFFGQMLNQTNTFKGLDLSNVNQDRDTYARINNIIIEQVPSDGFTYKGRGESFISDIMVRWTRGKGFVLDCTDTFFSKLSSGITAEEAFYINCANCTFNQCKGWFGTIGYNVTGKRNTFIGCESQDNTTLLDLKGESNQFFGIYLESAGVRNESVSVDNSTSVIIRSTAMNNTIYGKADDRKQFFSNGTQGYVLDIENGAKYNKVEIECRNVKQQPVKYASAIGKYNKVNIWGQRSDGSWIQTDSENFIEKSIIEKGTCDNLNGYIIKKNEIKQINITATNTSAGGFTDGCVIATISDVNFRPSDNIDLIGNCFNSNDKSIGTCTITVNKNNGNIAVWNLNSQDTVKIKTNSIMI